MVKPRGKTPPAAADDRETRERILAAAHVVFLRQGTANARTSDIAREAGVNKALLHYYFTTKDNLADAVFTASLAQLMPRVFGILADRQQSIEQKVRAVVREQVDFHAARPYLASYLVSEIHAEPERVQRLLAGVGKPPLAVLRRQLAAAAAAGEIRPIRVEHFVVNLMGLLVFPFVVRPVLEVMLGISARRFPAFLEERKRALPDFFLAGLRP